MPRKPVGGKRLHLRMNDAVRLRLEELQDETGAESLVEVIRRALVVYDMVWTETQSGNELVLRDKDSGREELLRVLI